jgi:ABC-2 type transport system ATP-binding protein
MSDIAIRTRGLGRDFQAVTALDDLSIEVPAGIIFGFLGPNGAGKTTTIRLLLGLLEPGRGTAEVLGHDVRKDADRIRAASGALLEHTGLYERLTAEDNLEFYGRIARLSVAERKARARELLTHFGLWERRGEPAGKWSRGMKQKLAVARALLARPRLIFLDEPTAGLDPVAAASLRDDLASLASREGTTVFLTTHNLDEAERLCRRVAVIRAGRLLAEGPVEELRRGQAAPIVEIRGRVFGPDALARLRQAPGVAAVEEGPGILVVTWTGEVRTAEAVRALVENGAEIEEIVNRRPTFEDAFLKLVKDETQEDRACSAI